MRKTSIRIREEIAKLQDVLKAAETREAERIGRIALKAGLGEIEIEDGALQAALEDLVERFRAAPQSSIARSLDGQCDNSKIGDTTKIPPGTAQGSIGEA